MNIPGNKLGFPKTVLTVYIDLFVSISVMVGNARRQTKALDTKKGLFVCNEPNNKLSGCLYYGLILYVRGSFTRLLSKVSLLRSL